jgi:hypothetical protein
MLPVSRIGNLTAQNRRRGTPSTIFSHGILCRRTVSCTDLDRYRWLLALSVNPFNDCLDRRLEKCSDLRSDNIEINAIPVLIASWWLTQELWCCQSGCQSLGHGRALRQIWCNTARLVYCTCTLSPCRTYLSWPQCHVQFHISSCEECLYRVSTAPSPYPIVLLVKYSWARQVTKTEPWRRPGYMRQ